ncbi:ricin-type beta-trefoil lectin domain protein [Streptomyces sp. NBC_01795]|uniref:ricin-type beta-trefoil lectin domain protein n=1 Tax=unclassified Streptomyces TaxID=2593676 RepID=UPI002DDBF1F9|nr:MULTISPECIES: ricin-type beta-trefoil lectin domain protein [unclassified Streptomyces]WSA93501.1 ricin-type beta-trefoil lectin domain protein [Streptomyces sp. NBC_01795]WSB77871.1 ricin-type beta-trefoil lectin domain protein [Streptomyces sp. NBC_01775]WSS13882.1 ricin-type beta-trefoil lectin domain protein [Streptomyces sp. NBC_01186]
MARARPVTAVVAALVMALGGAGAATAASAPPSPGAEAEARQSVRAGTPLPPELEKIRAEEAQKLYGSPGERPVEQRKSSLISLGDSEISGEGVGTYEPGTNGPDNWCHRSPDSAVHRTGIQADVTYNVACSGASTENIRVGGTKQYADELVQSDSLAIKARNTRLKQIMLVVGANDDLQFGPVMTDCVIRYLTLQGPCEPKYDPGWQARIDGLVPKVERTVSDLKSVMRDAGYADGDYQLVVMGYPSPIGPDIKDNPKFPGKLVGGCVGHTSDAAWGRNTAVPAFEKGVRKAAQGSGASYLDASRLFHGHEVCMENPWARGLYVDIANPFPPDANSVRQSFHPNERGHGAFASCFTEMYKAGQNGVREASCADPDGKGSPKLYQQAWDDSFKPLRNAATGTCLDADSAHSAVGTDVRGWACGSQRNQLWWYDSAGRALYAGQTHDRCVESEGGVKEGAALALGNCSGAAAQQFVKDGATLKAASGNLCVSLPGAEAQARLATCDGSAAQRFS